MFTFNFYKRCITEVTSLLSFVFLVDTYGGGTIKGLKLNKSNSTIDSVLKFTSAQYLCRKSIAAS
jgi:hypothetical protein